jgi:hypothetical protein
MRTDMRLQFLIKMTETPPTCQSHMVFIVDCRYIKSIDHAASSCCIQLELIGLNACIHMSLLLVLLLHLVSLVSTTVQSIAFVSIGPLQWNISWVEQVGVMQTHTLTVRDLTARISYSKTDIPSDQYFFTLNSISASELKVGATPFTGLQASVTYLIQVLYPPPFIVLSLLCRLFCLLPNVYLLHPLGKGSRQCLGKFKCRVSTYPFICPNRLCCMRC